MHTMQIELNAVNEDDFEIPDEAGSQIRGKPVDPRDHYQRVLSTPLDLPSVVLQLQHSGHQIKLSANAGRFLVSFSIIFLSSTPMGASCSIVDFVQCNHTYYKSLRYSEERNEHNKEKDISQEHISLFVHVPHFSTITFDQQVSRQLTQFVNISEYHVFSILADSCYSKPCEPLPRSYSSGGCLMYFPSFADEIV